MDLNARTEHQSARPPEQQKDHAVIILHGLCGSTLELGTIPKALKRANCTVVEMQIPHYSAALVQPGVSPNWMEWCAEVESKVVQLKEEHKTVSICGLSMGATLALAVASMCREILCMVLLSPVLRYDGWSVPWYHPLMAIPYHLGYRNWTYKESDPYGIKNFEMRRRVAAALTRDGIAAVGAAAIPARQLWGANKLMKYVRESLPLVRASTMVVHSIDDETAAPRNAEMILQNISSEVRKAVWLGDCYHIITVDNERELVTNETVQFIKRNIDAHSNDLSLKYLLHNAPLRDRRTF